MKSENAELRMADEFVRHTNCNLYLTGKAGTGKTTFLHNLRKDSPKRMVVTAPTGVAAINAGGVTLHSFFQMPFGPFIPGSETTARYKFSRDKINIIKSLDLLVIDEISMVRADLLDCVDSVLRRYRRSNLPFGGVQLLLIGDLHQLSPVVKNADWQLLGQYYDSPYFFSSNALAGTELISIELRHIYRQADSRFIDLLNNVRDSKLDSDTLTELNNRYIDGFSDQRDEGYITLCTHNSSADAINGSRLQELSIKSHYFEAEIEGDFPEKSYPTPVKLELKPDAQVMFVRNDSSPDKRFFNGKIGKITRISGKNIWIKCPDDEEEIIVEPATWENIEYSLNQETMEISENKIGAFIQYPLKLAWAITIHKSQGLTFDRAIIDAQAAFTHGQVYVALSRCRTLEGVVLSSPLQARAVKTDQAVLSFVKQAGENAPTEEHLSAAKIRYQQQLLLECFDFQLLQNLLDRLVSTVGRNPDLVQVTGVGDLQELQQITVNEIGTIGTNFRRQLQGLFTENVMPAKDAAVLERIQKASIYFQEKFKAGIGKNIPHLQIETDNKEIRKKTNNIYKRLLEETAVKLAAVTSCKDGFRSSDYLRAISSAEIKTVPARATKHATSYSEADVGHPELFQTLKEWRSQKAKDANLAHFQVMHQKTLIQIAVNLPDSLEALIKIKGIGKKLAEKYGEELVQLVSDYRLENKITEVILPAPTETQSEEPEVAKKTKEAKIPTRTISLKLLDDKLTPAQIAEQREMALTTVEGHLADCIEKGELAVARLLSSDRQRTAERKLKKIRGEKLREIKQALGDDFSYGEIKYVLSHMKYLETKD